MWDSLQAFFSDHRDLLVGLGILSLVTLVLSAILLPVVVVRLPADYFARPSLPRIDEGHPWLWAERILRNLFGLIFVLAGILMLVLPGQGLLTILIGLILLDFPGKHRLLRRLLGIPALAGALNKLRARFGKPPFELGDREAE